jgi:hypothetical protein
MIRSRFVQPNTDVLTLANGDTLIVRRRLNTGEQRESFAACSSLVEQPDGSTKRILDPLLVGRAQVASYLVDWSLEGDGATIRGLDLAQRLAVIDLLESDAFHEIRTAIAAHEATHSGARVAEKNGRSGDLNAPVISHSPSAVVGASNGSENLIPTIT